MTVPDEAIEVAMRRFYGPAFDDIMATEDISYALDQMRAALEAAAPYLRAQALENAADDLSLHGNVRDRLRARAVAERGGE